MRDQAPSKSVNHVDEFWKAQKEKTIENAILQLLRSLNVFVYKVDNTPTFDTKTNKFRSLGKFRIKGVPDICGVYKGKPLFIEVKSHRGVLSVDQKKFLTRAQEEGAIVIVAKKPEDVLKGLGLES